MSDIVSKPYHPTMCCERCVFGRGEHAGWCDGRPEKKKDEAALANAGIIWIKVWQEQGTRFLYGDWKYEDKDQPR